MTGQQLEFKEFTGFTLFEIVAALALTALIFAASFPVLKTGAAAKHKTESGLAAEIDALFVQTLIEKAAAKAGGICFFPGIFIADKSGKPSPGTIGAAAGFLLPASTLAFHPPAENSQGGRLVCAQRPWNEAIDPAPLSGISVWLGNSVDGFVLLRGAIRRIRKNPAECSGEIGYSANLSPDDGLNALIPDSAAGAPVLMYLPVEDGFVLTADQSGVLRRRSIISGENAPLIPAVERFEIERQPDGKFKFALKIKDIPLRTFTITIAPACKSYEWLG